MHIINQFLPVEFIQLLKIIDDIVQCNITKILCVHVEISDITGVGTKQIISAHFIKLGKLDYYIGRNVAVSGFVVGVGLLCYTQIVGDIALLQVIIFP